MLGSDVGVAPQKGRISSQAVLTVAPRRCEKDDVGLIQEIDKQKRRWSTVV